jgi:hypothetical protein
MKDHLLYLRDVLRMVREHPEGTLRTVEDDGSTNGG